MGIAVIKREGVQPMKTPLEYCPICNCFYYDITGKKLCPHEKDYPHEAIESKVKMEGD